MTTRIAGVMVDPVTETLSNIAQDSVSGTKKTYEDTEEVVDTFKQVYMSAEQLREIADQLAGSVQYFHVD